MPAFTLSGSIAAILQFIAIMVLMTTLLQFRTVTGQGILPANEVTHITGLVNSTNQSIVSTSNSLSLRVQLGQSYNYSSNSISSIGIFQSLGGLAFIPAGFSLLMTTLWNLPGNMIAITNSIFTFQSPYVVIPFGIMAISAVFMTWYVIEFIFKGLSPITKTEISDI